MSKNSYRHKKYDTTIMQTRTVANIIEALNIAIKYRNLKEVAQYLNEERTRSLNAADGRKANSTDKKIKRLLELGYKIPKEVEDGFDV